METIIMTPGWYIEPPIDLEHKQYVLLDYLQKVDYSFMQKKLSPHYLNLEKMLEELNLFLKQYAEMNRIFQKEKYLYFDDNSKIEGYDEKNILEIKGIVDFSIPQISVRIEFGNRILVKTKQILY